MVRVGCFFLAFLTLLALCTAHSNLGFPLPYSRLACKGSENWCKRSTCTPIWKQGNAKARNRPDKPSATWKRGQEVEIVWHKNNHVGGFIRRSLVPVKHMFDHKWHEKTAFDFGCWQQGSFQCGKKNDKCGDDLKGRAYRGKVWYGGLQWQKKFPKYSDYSACSFVRIKGGKKLQYRYRATWSGSKRKCPTGATRVWQCRGGPCEKISVKERVPDEFKNGKSTHFVYAKDLGANVMKHGPIEPESETKQEKKMMESAVKEMKEDAEEDKMVGAEKQKMAVEVKIEVGKETKETKPMTDKNAKVKKVLVYNDFKVVEALYAGEDKVIKIDGSKAVFIRAFTLDGNDYDKEESPVGTVFFKFKGLKPWSEGKAPYVYNGNVGTLIEDYRKVPRSMFNKKLELEVVVWKGNKRYAMEVTLKLET